MFSDFKKYFNNKRKAFLARNNGRTSSEKSVATFRIDQNKLKEKSPIKRISSNSSIHNANFDEFIVSEFVKSSSRHSSPISNKNSLSISAPNSPISSRIPISTFSLTPKKEKKILKDKTPIKLTAPISTPTSSNILNTPIKNNIKPDITIDANMINLPSFAQLVFDYYYKKLRPQSHLLENAFYFEHLLKNKYISIPKDKKMSLITADEQARKTFLCIPIELIYLALGYSIVCVVVDVDQKEQLMRRLLAFMKELSDYIITKNASDIIDTSIFNEIVYKDSHVKCEDDKIKNAINGSKPRIVIVIKHEKHIQRINSFITADSKIVLVIDEAHKTAGYKSINEPFLSDKEVKYDIEIAKLKNSAKKYIAVSATPQDIMCVDTSLCAENIVKIPSNEGYVGLKNSDFFNIETRVYKKKKNSEIQNDSDDDDIIFEKEKMPLIHSDIYDTIQNILNEEPIKRHNNKSDIDDIHPHIILLKAERLLKNMTKIFKELKGKSGNSLTLVNYTGRGITLYHPSLGNEIITINELAAQKINGNHFFKSRQAKSPSINDVIQFLAERGVEQHPHILILAYDMAIEGMSFISHYDKPQNWHLTSAILALSESVAAADAKQTTSRLFGYHQDNIRPRIYCNHILKEQIIKGYLLTNDLIDNVMNNTKQQVISFLDNYEVFENRVPKKYNTIKGVKIKTKPNPNAKIEKANLKASNTIDFMKITAVEKENKIGINGRYILINPDILNKTTLQYFIVDNTIKNIINKDKIGITLLRSEVNNWLMNLNNNKIKDIDHINGNYDTSIVLKMIKVDDINTKGLLYWKQNKRIYMRYNL